MKEKIRKLKHNLYISGIGVILLGAWGCLKVVMLLYFSGGGIDSSEVEAEYLLLFQLVALITIMFTNAIIMAFHLYVGINAMKAGKKGNKKKLYLFVAAFMGLLSFLSLRGDFLIIREDIMQIDVAIASFLTDVAFIFIIFDIIYSSVKIRKLEKEY